MTGVEISDGLRAKTRALGDEGAGWLLGLDRLLADVAEEWDLDVEGSLGCGSAGVVVAVRVRPDARPGALKLVMPNGLRGNATFVEELVALEAGAGSFVDVLRVDTERRVLLMPRLGRTLEELGLTVEQQLDVLAETLPRTWRPLPVGAPFRSGPEKALALRTFITDLWDELQQPCSQRPVNLALALLEERHAAMAAREPAGLVYVHGDAHPANVLERAPGAGTFALIDPEGLRSEPSHDLGIPLRGWNEEALGSPDPAATVLRWCVRLAGATGVDAAAVVAWAMIERVSTGLFLTQLGVGAEARAYLAVADLLAEALDAP